MLRYLVTFPGDVSPDFLRQVLAEVKAAADQWEARDIALSHGGTITMMKPVPPKRPAIVRRAMALHR